MNFDYSKKLSSFRGLSHAFTTRSSGNLAFHVGDDEKRVLQNHGDLARTLGYKREALTYMKQIHSSVVVRVDEGNFETPPTCDALVSDAIGVPLMVMVADCSPIILYDPTHHAVAVAHAGRVGAFKNILTCTIDLLASEYGTKRSDLVVCVGASIKSCCYEVGSEVADEAKDLGFEYALIKRGSKIYLDIDAILRSQLEGVGEVEFLSSCTACTNDRYYSYRKDRLCGKGSGRNAGVVWLS